jgi:membrane associated rhomboid family serine protease
MTNEEVRGVKKKEPDKEEGQTEISATPAEAPSSKSETSSKGKEKADTSSKDKKEKTQAQTSVAFGMPLVTLLLVAINILVFLMMYKRDPGALWHPSSALLMNGGADYGPLFAGGQWWRAWTSGFVHIGVIHLGMNMLALWNIGGRLEPQIGVVKYVLVYCISLIGASMMSLYCHPFIESAGASGAIFGLLGCQMITILGLFNQIPKLRLLNYLLGDLIVIGLYMAIGFFVPFVDGFAHLGGFLAGVAASIVLFPLTARKKLPNLLNIAALGALLFVLKQADTMVAQRTEQAAAAMTPYQRAHINAILKKNELPFWLPSRIGSPAELLGSASLEAPDYATAIKIADSEIDLDKTNAHAYYSRALVHHKFNHDQEALKDVNEALERIPSEYSFIVLKATIELWQNRPGDAIADARTALKSKSKNHAEAYDIQGCAKLSQGDRKDALNFFSKAVAEDSGLGRAYFHRAIVYELSGEKSRAQQNFIRAQDNNYVPDGWDLQYMNKKHLSSPSSDSEIRSNSQQMSSPSDQAAPRQ